MWCFVDLVWTNISEEHITSIFRVEKSTSSLQPPGHAGSSLVDFSTLKMEAIRSSKTLAHTRSTRHHIPEDSILHSHRCENLKSYMCENVFLSSRWDWDSLLIFQDWRWEWEIFVVDQFFTTVSPNVRWFHSRKHDCTEKVILGITFIFIHQTFKIK
jgi:hypothetical protein